MDTEAVKQITNFILTFSSIFYEALPFIVLGAVISGFLEEFVPQSIIARVIPRSRVLSLLLGGLLGMIFPMCECGIIPVMRRLLRKGLPLSTCTAYLLSGPIINVVVGTSTFVAFSAPTDLSASRGSYPMSGLMMVALRMGLGYLVAVGTSLLVEWQWRRHGNAALLMPLAIPPVQDKDPADQKQEQRSWPQRLGHVSETALRDCVDITVFLILGALLAALTRQWLDHEQIARISTSQPVVVILVMMGLAILLCLCSEADAFVAASFTTLPSSSKLAFLVLGPMMDFKLYILYTRVFRPRLIWTIIPAVVVQVLLYSILAHYLWAWLGPTPGAAPPVALAP